MNYRERQIHTDIAVTEVCTLLCRTPHLKETEPAPGDVEDRMQHHRLNVQL